MTGCWVTWPAQITMSAGVGDIRPYLDAATAMLHGHSDVAEAHYVHDPHSTRVSFVLRVRYGITEVIAEDQAFDALNWSLPAAGLATRHARPATRPVAWLEFTPWPSEFKWW